MSIQRFHRLKKRTGVRVVMGVVIVAVLAVFAWHRIDVPPPASVQKKTEKNDAQKFEKTFRVFATRGRITFYEEKQKAQQAAQEIITELQKIHNKIDLWDDQSELSQLNEQASEQPVRCSDTLWPLFQEAKRAFEETEGAFDVTVGPLMKLWGFRAERDSWPEEEQIQKTLNAVGFDDVVELIPDQQSVRFQHENTYVDFGGLAKGYGVDLAANIAKDHGIERGLIVLGGDIAALSKPPPGKSAYNIGIRDPLHPSGLLQSIQVLDCFISSSGNYEKYRNIEGTRITHIIDPRNGQPVQDIAGTTVVANKGVTAEAFSTAVFVDGESLAETYTNEYPEPSRALIVRTQTESDKPKISTYDWKWAVGE